MAIVVVGGHTRNIGKTSVVAGLISAIPERNWTAIKVTQHDHGCPLNGPLCGCAADEHTWAIVDEHDPDGQGDTCRFLRAGARRALWVRVKQGHLADAWPDLGATIAGSENVILESNSLMALLKPDVYLSVLDPAAQDFKASAREFLGLADAVIMHGQPGAECAPAWNGVPLSLIHSKPVFNIQPPPYVTPELVEFVRGKIGRTARKA